MGRGEGEQGRQRERKKGVIIEGGRGSRGAGAEGRGAKLMQQGSIQEIVFDIPETRILRSKNGYLHKK